MLKFLGAACPKCGVACSNKIWCAMGDRKFKKWCGILWTQNGGKFVRLSVIWVWKHEAEAETKAQVLPSYYKYPFLPLITCHLLKFRQNIQANIIWQWKMSSFETTKPITVVYTVLYKTKPCASLRGFTTYSGTYGSHSQGHSVGPLFHCHSNLHWLWI